MQVYQIINKQQSIDMYVTTLTDYMFENGWRVLKEVEANNDLLQQCVANEAWFDNCLYNDYMYGMAT